MRARARVCVCVRARVRACVCVRACVQGTFLNLCFVDVECVEVFMYVDVPLYDSSIHASSLPCTVL